jgi:hypothetical protein
MTTPLFAITLVRADHFRSFYVRPARSTGWEASEHHDQRIVQQQRYTDWHRVEHTLSRFRHEITELCAQGWCEA